MTRTLKNFFFQKKFLGFDIFLRRLTHISSFISVDLCSIHLAGRHSDPI